MQAFRPSHYKRDLGTVEHTQREGHLTPELPDVEYGDESQQASRDGAEDEASPEHEREIQSKASSPSWDSERSCGRYQQTPDCQGEKVAAQMDQIQGDAKHEDPEIESNHPPLQQPQAAKVRRLVMACLRPMSTFCSRS